jgi:hypothetical protein
MRIVDFKKLEIKTEVEYKVIDFTFELKEILDIPFLEFAKELSKDMKDKIDAANLSQYKDDALVFQFKTDLNSRDLDDMIPQLVSNFVLNLGIKKSEFKHGEKRLNVPPGLDKDVDFYFVLLPDDMDKVGWGIGWVDGCVGG